MHGCNLQHTGHEVTPLHHKDREIGIGHYIGDLDARFRAAVYVYTHVQTYMLHCTEEAQLGRNSTGCMHSINNSLLLVYTLIEMMNVNDYVNKHVVLFIECGMCACFL